MIGIVLIYRLCYFTNVIVNAKYLVTSFVLSDANSGQVYQNNKTKVTAEWIVHNLDGILNPVPLSKSYFKRKVNILILKFNLYVDDLIFFNWFDFWQTYSITLNQLLFACEEFPRGSWVPRRREYFSERTNPYRMIVITTWIWIRLGRDHL